ANEGVMLPRQKRSERNKHRESLLAQAQSDDMSRLLMQQRNRCLEDDDKKPRLLLRKITDFVLIRILAIDSGGSKLQQIGLTKRFDDRHRIRFVETVLEYLLHFIELLIEGLFEFLFRHRRYPRTHFLETQQDDREDICDVLTRIGHLQLAAFPQYIADQGRLFLGERIPDSADLSLIHPLDPVIYQVDRLVGDESH